MSFHTHSGVILRPMGTQSDDDMVPEDLWTYKRFSALGEKLTGYPAISIFHDFKYHPKEIITGTQDWVYEHLGALFWTVEMWAPNKEAGITDYKWIDWYRDHPAEDDLKLLKWSDEQCGGAATSTGGRSMHPQLGAVEIGGWDKMNFWRNPPPHLREREAARFPAWMTQIALSLPRARAAAHRGARARRRHLARPLRGRQQRLAAGLRDASGRSTRKTVRGVIFEIHLPETPRGCAGQRQAPPSRARSSKAMRRRPAAARLPAGARRHRRPRRGRVGRARAARARASGCSARADRAGVGAAAK